MRLVLLLALALGVFLLAGWFRRLPPRARQQAIVRLVLAGAGVVLLVAVLSGRINALVALLAAAVPLVLRLAGAKRVFDRGAPASGPGAGRRSRVSTRFVDMTLDHDTGEMDGQVREGHFEGRLLSELGLERILELLAECRAHDARSAQVLEAYLDRVHGDAWRQRDSGPRGPAAPPSASAMTVKEAREILGVDETASSEDIIAAHRRLMQRLHPDRGGSAYLAAKVNAARDLLTAGP